MFTKLFNRKQEEKKPVVGRRVELAHDMTVYQYGTVFIDGVRYSAKTNNPNDGMLKGTMVEVIEDNCPYGTRILTVKRV